MFEICLRSASSYLCGAVAVAGILTCESRADSSKDYICSVTFARARVGVLFRCVSFIILNDIFDISMRSKMLSALKCLFRCLKNYTQVRRPAVEMKIMFLQICSLYPWGDCSKQGQIRKYSVYKHVIVG
jgi:hypothetical protein